MPRGGRNYQPQGVARGRAATTPDRIDDWLARRPAHAHLLMLSYEGLNGLEEIEQREVADLPSQGAGAELLAAAQDHADDIGQVGRYLLLLRSRDGGNCGTKAVRVTPLATDLPVGTDAIEGPTMTGIIGQALRHNETVMRMYVNSMGSVLGRMHDLLRLEQSENELLRRRMREMSMDESEGVEERETKRQLLQKISDIATDIVLPTVAQQWAARGGPVPGGEAE